jgi:hypothetical protein
MIKSGENCIEIANRWSYVKLKIFRLNIFTLYGFVTSH